jgi:hypothetical protein
MPSSTPFVDHETGLLDRDQIRREAEPLAKLVALFALLVLAPLLVAFALGGGALAFLFTVLAQFVLAVGTGITLMYVIARAIALSNDGSAHARVHPDTRPGRDSARDDPVDGPVDEPAGDASDSAQSGDEPGDPSEDSLESDDDTSDDGD